MGTIAETVTTYLFDQTTGTIQAVNEHGEQIIFSDGNPNEDSVHISGDVNDQSQMSQVVIGQEVEVVSMDQTRIHRPPVKSNRPSLLRRGPRTSTVPSHITAYPPQISPSVLSRYGLTNANPSPTASYLSRLTPVAPKPVPVTSRYVDRKPIINADSSVSTSLGRQSISIGRGSAVTGRPSNEEIVIWQTPDMEDCEIIQVDEEQLQQYFQSQQAANEQEVELKYEDGEVQTQFQVAADGSIIDPVSGQQIIICGDGEELSDLVGNYVQLQSMTNAQVRKSAKVSKRKLNTELKCQEEGCESYVHNVIDLRKHLQGQHMIELDEENILFANDDEFKAWRANYERDRKVSFIYRGGTKKISPERAVTYLICHRSGIYKPTPGAATERKRKMKPQGSCKIGTHCTAGVKLLKNLINGTIDATVCHTHYGHELENIQHLRVNVTIKEILLGKFDEGMSFAQVLQYVHHNPDGLEGLRVVDRRAIRNIYDQWKKMRIIVTTPQQTFVVHDAGDKEKEDVDAVDPLQDSIILHTAEIKEAALEHTDGKETCSIPIPTNKSESEVVQSSAEETSHVTPQQASASVPESSAETPSATAKRPSKTTKPASPIKTLNELVHESIENLLDHGESGPTVLYYKRAGNKNPVYEGEHGNEISKSLTKDDLCVVLQTPVQRQLLQLFGRVLYVDIISATDLDLLVIAVLDEFLTAIPVAWMIVSEISPANVELCFRCIKQNCVEVKCGFFYSTKTSDHHATWSKVYGKKPRLMLAQEDTIKDFANLVKRQFDEEELREQFTKELETLVTTPDRQTYDECLKSIKLKSSSLYKTLAKDWLLNKSQWAFHARLHLPFVIEESFARLKKFVLFKGTKKLSRNIGNVLKIGYDRCFQRNKSLFKGDLKFQQILDAIQANHEAVSETDIKVKDVSSNKYLVQDRQDSYTVYDLHTECKCRIRCKSCEVCAHRYWCTCGDNPNFCTHAHQVCIYTKPSWPVNVKRDEAQPTLVKLIEVKHEVSGQGSESAELEEEEWYEDGHNLEFLRCEEETTETMNSVQENCEPVVLSPPHGKSPSRSNTTNPESAKPKLVDESLVKSNQRRISSRVKQKVSKPMEDEFEAVVRKRGRRDSTVTQESPAKDSETSAPSTVPTDPPASPSKGKKAGGRSPKRQRNSTSESQDAVREEIQNLLKQIGSINDEKRLTDIKKRVSAIAGSLGSN